MWLVLQLAVALLYWDVPVLPEMQVLLVGRVTEEDEQPLVRSQGDDGAPGSGSYALVLSDESETRFSEDLPSDPGVTPASDDPRSPDDPFSNFSASQGVVQNCKYIINS